MGNIGNADLRGMERPINDQPYDNTFIQCRFRRASSETEPMFPAGNISIGARADRRRRAAADDRKRKLSARRGVDRKAGRFLSPRLRVLLWSFLPTREESGVPRMIERTIYNPANPQICRRWAMQEGTDCHSPLRGFAMTDTENANLRGMERFFAYAQNDRLGYAFPPFVILRPKGEESFSARFIGDRT